MKAWTRWQDWVTAGLGVALIIAPWMVGVDSNIAFTLNAWFVGVLSLAAALESLSQPSRFAPEWITLLLGIWLLLSPWALSFLAVGSAAITAWIIAMLLIVTSGLTLGETRRFHAGVPT